MSRSAVGQGRGEVVAIARTRSRFSFPAQRCLYQILKGGVLSCNPVLDSEGGGRSWGDHIQEDASRDGGFPDLFLLGPGSEEGN